MMSTGLERILKAEMAEGITQGIAQGIIESAVLMLNKGKSLSEIADLLNLSDEQVKQVEAKAGVTTQLA